MISCARPSFQTFEDKNLILKAKAISRNYNIKVVIILMVLLLNQVPLPDVQQAKCQDGRGLQQRKDLFMRQPSEQTREQISNPPP